MDTDGFRKAIHFDLDTATVEATFGKKNTSTAYRKIRKFLESNGFAHSRRMRILKPLQGNPVRVGGSS